MQKKISSLKKALPLGLLKTTDSILNCKLIADLIDVYLPDLEKDEGTLVYYLIENYLLKDDEKAFELLFDRSTEDFITAIEGVKFEIKKNEIRSFAELDQFSSFNHEERKRKSPWNKLSQEISALTNKLVLL